MQKMPFLVTQLILILNSAGNLAEENDQRDRDSRPISQSRGNLNPDFFGGPYSLEIF